MAEITAPTGQWVDVYEGAGIPVGTKIIIQSKSSGYVMVSEGAESPAPGVVAGYLLRFTDPLLVTADGPGAWAMSMSAPLSLYVETA